MTVIALESLLHGAFERSGGLTNELETPDRGAP